MNPLLDLDALVDDVAERVAQKLLGRMPQNSPQGDEPLLLTIEQAARKLGRTVPAVEHLIREGKISVVRIDRRVFIDFRDILSLIAQHKVSGGLGNDGA
jgi:excisionase family DNA binding protein